MRLRIEPAARWAVASVVATAMVATSACGGGESDRPAQAPTNAVAPPAPVAPPASQPARAPDAVNGRLLYQRHCSACHGTAPDPRALGVAGDGAAVIQAIGIVRIMNSLSSVIGVAEADDIAQWLVDPR